MPQPTASQVHVDRPLTNMSVAYMQRQTRFIADRVFGTLPVDKKSDLYFVYGREFFLSDDAQLRAPATESAGGGYGITTDNYACKVYAYHKDVDGQTRANTDNPLDADRDATQHVSQKMLIKREVEFLGSYFQPSTWTGSTTGADITPLTLWDAANNTFIEDVDAQIWHLAKTGYFPNKIIFGSDAWKAIRNDAEVLDRIKYTERAIATTDIVASLLAPPEEPDFEVLVATAVKNNAAEGATVDMEFIASSKDVLLCYAEPEPGLQKVSAGYIFTWTGYLGAGAYGNAIYTFPMPQLGVQGGVTTRVEGEIAFDPKLVAADLGAYFHDVVS